MRRVRLVVRGTVQGVGFRWFAREAARRSGIDGWARNLGDGTVEIAAAGEQEVVDRFIRAIGRGPEGARVSDVQQFTLEDGIPLPRPFAILR